MSKKDVEKNKKLVQIIRQIAKEVCYEIIDEHLNDYEHKEKKTEEFETEST
jgi:hypothetical protein